MILCFFFHAKETKEKSPHMRHAQRPDSQAVTHPLTHKDAMDDTNSNTSNKKIRLLLHCQGGYPPYLTPPLLQKHFHPSSPLITNHLILGIEINDTCNKAIYKTNECKKPQGYTFEPYQVHDTLKEYTTLLCPIWSWGKNTKNSKKQEMIVKKDISTQNRDSYIILPTPNGNQKLESPIFQNICIKSNTTYKIGMYDYLSPHKNENLKSNKRIEQSYKRTFHWYQQQSKDVIFPFLLLPPPDNDDDKINYIKKTQEGILSTFKSKYLHSSAGIAYYNQSSQTSSLQQEIHTHLIQQNKLIIDINSNSLKDIIHSILYGMNVIGTNLPQAYAQRGYALLFHQNLGNKKQKASKVFSLLNLNNPSLKTDDTPISDSCGCMTCQNYTKGYVYHLIQVKEILREILLFVHNLHTLLKLCEWVGSPGWRDVLVFSLEEEEDCSL